MHKKYRYIIADVASLLVFIAGIIVIIGWISEIHSLRSLLLPAEMKANTAINFIFLGISLFLINPKRISKDYAIISRILSSYIIIISILTVIEYAASVNIGIDFFSGSDQAARFPGRMALNTAVCFILAGISNILLSKKSSTNNEFIRVVLLFMAFICLLSLVGYIFDIEGYSSYFIFNAMAFNTSILFIILFTGMLMVLRIDYEPMKKLEYQTIAGFGVALLTIVLIGVIAVKNSSRVIEANKVTNNTFQIISNIEEILSLTKDLETGVRGFALTNDSVFLDPYLTSKDKIKKVLINLKEALSDNQAQKMNLDTLDRLLNESFLYLNELINIRKEKGLEEASKLVATAKGENITDHIRSVTASMKEIETHLLQNRSAYENQIAGRTLNILLIFIFVPFALVVFIYIILRRNIIEHYRNQEAIRNMSIELEQRYKILFNEMPDGFGLHEMIFDKNNKPTDYRFLDVNPAFETLTGLKKKNIIGRTILEIAPDLEKFWIETYGEVVLNKKTIRFENYSRNFNRYYEVSASPFATNQFVAIFIDITERKKAEETIKAQLKEKEVLLRELYHRTKNNMQVISSFLGLKSESVPDENVKLILADMKNRIQTIALVHQKLYQSQNLSWVDLKEYIKDLSELLLSSYFSETQIELKLDLENINVLIDFAIPCGLIVNELVSNSIKYAFPNCQKGELRISLKRLDNEVIELSVSDNGIGIPENFDLESAGTLGLLLFKTIAEDQLQGHVVMDTKNGVAVTIRFKDSHYQERV